MNSRDTSTISTPDACRTSRLQGLVCMVLDQYRLLASISRLIRTETSEHSQFGGVIRHRAHQPVCICLPHCIQEAVEYHEPDMGRVVFVQEVHFVSTRRSLLSTGICPKERVDWEFGRVV